MLINLMLGLPIMALCLSLQSLLIVIAVRYYAHNEQHVEHPSFTNSLLVIHVVMFLLVIGNLAQVSIWALLFMLLDEFKTFETAFYHSAVNFSTLGYGDIVMSEKHRLLGPLQAINGVLMIGVSTAALLSTFQNSIKKAMDARKNK